jgi:hypothetical protein
MIIKAIIINSIISYLNTNLIKYILHTIIIFILIEIIFNEYIYKHIKETTLEICIIIRSRNYLN